MHRMLHWPSVALNRAISSNLPCADYFKELESEIELEFTKEELYNGKEIYNKPKETTTEIKRKKDND